MCSTFSALALRNGEIPTLIFMPEYTDSHDELIAANGLSDDRLSQICRLEYVPANGDYINLDSYELRVDEGRVPDWFTENAKERIARQLRERVAKMIVTNKRQLLLGGCWIVAGSAKVQDVVHARIITVEGLAMIGNVAGCSRLERVRGDVHIRTVAGNARLALVVGNATIQFVGGNSVLNAVGGNSRIDLVERHACLHYVEGKASVGAITDNACITCLGGSAQLGAAKEGTRLKSALRTALIGTVERGVQIDFLEQSTTIQNDYRTKETAS